MNNENKIVVTSWNGKSWEMTPEQIEAAYRYKEHQYRIDDAYNQLELNADWIEENMVIHTMKLSSFRKS